MTCPGSVGHRVPMIGGGESSTPDTMPHTRADSERREMECVLRDAAAADRYIPPDFSEIPATPVTYGPERPSDHGASRSAPMAKGLGARASDWIKSTVGSRWSSRSMTTMAQAVSKSTINSVCTGVPHSIDLTSDRGEVHATAQASIPLAVPTTPADSVVIEGDSGLSQYPDVESESYVGSTGGLLLDDPPEL